MFDSMSRYYRVDIARLVAPNGEVIAYTRRRFLPRGNQLPVLSEVRVKQGDRLDLISNRTLGNPELYWRICDANNAMLPEELTAEAGWILRVPIPQP